MSKASDERFLPYQTMFKLNTPRITEHIEYTNMDPGRIVTAHCAVRFVECVNCTWGCELESVLMGEVNQYQCPECRMTIWEFYQGKGKESRPVPEVNGKGANRYGIA